MEITVKTFLVLTVVFMLATGTIASNPAALATTITSTIGTTTLSTSTTTFPVSTVSQTSTSPVSTVSQTSTSPVSTLSTTSTLTTTVTGTNTATQTVTATVTACDPFNTTNCQTNTETNTTTVTATATATATGTTTFPTSTVSQTSTSAVSTVSQTSTSAVSTVSTVSESVSTLTSTTVTTIPIAEIDEDYRCTNVNFSTVEGLICPIPQDIDGNFLVDAVLSGKNKNIVSSSNPGQLYKVFRIDSGLDTFNSLSFSGTLPSNWIVNPNKAPGGVTVLFVPSGSDPITITGAVLSGIDITQGVPDNDPVCGGTQGSVDVEISDITAVAGQPLGPGDVIYIWVKMQYGLKGQIVDPTDYPCTHPDDADATLNPGDVDVSTSGNLIVSKK